MPQKDTTQLKEKIISFIQNRGPSLPVHIASHIGMSMLFTSAFLSELLSEKKLKMSNMKIGSSSLYLIPGQEEKLTNFSQHLKSKERDAYEILKGKEILKDSEQEPAIKVALRAIKDFAIPIQENNELYWKHIKSEKKVSPQKTEPLKEDSPRQEPEEKEENGFIGSVKQEFQRQEQTKEQEEIQKTPKENSSEEKKETQKKKTTNKKTRKTSNKKNEQFFNKVKEYLSRKNIEISDIISFNNKELILKVLKEEREKLIVAHNKKRIDEKDLINAHKKAEEHNLKYMIFCLGDPLKKITSLIDAIRSLEKIEKIE